MRDCTRYRLDFVSLTKNSKHLNMNGVTRKISLLPFLIRWKKMKCLILVDMLSETHRMTLIQSQNMFVFCVTSFLLWHIYPKKTTWSTLCTTVLILEGITWECIPNRDSLMISCGLIHEAEVVENVTKVIQESLWHHGTQKGQCFAVGGRGYYLIHGEMFKLSPDSIHSLMMYAWRRVVISSIWLWKLHFCYITVSHYVYPINSKHIIARTNCKNPHNNLSMSSGSRTIR